MDFTLTEDQQAFRDTARQFATARMLPQAARWDTEKIFPEEVEAAIKAYPDVYDAIVVGLPDDRFGERVAVVVRLRDGAPDLALETLVAHCRDHVAGYKVPRQLLLIDEIPLTAAGKPDSKAARALF